MRPFFNLGLALLMLTSVVISRADTPAPSESAESGTTVAVADFSGPDREMGRFLADTLLTDLSQSDKLRMTERAEIKQALAELKLQSTGLTEPQQVKKFGKLVGADRLVVGGFLVRDEQMLINARLLDVRSGRVIPGSAASVSGPRSDSFALAHRLSRILHRRITGDDLPLSGELAQDPLPVEKPRVAVRDTGRSRALRPASVRPSSVVTERDLAGVLSQLSQQCPSLSGQIVPLRGLNAPVTRLRVLAVLAKLIFSAEELLSYEDPTLSLTPDAAQLPQWGQAFVAAALDRGLWPSNRSLHPQDTATWGYLNILLERVKPANSSEGRGRMASNSNYRSGRGNDVPGGGLRARSEEESDGYSGLIVDARGLGVERAMSMRILDESGRVVYPDPMYLPDSDFLQDNGMAAYLRDTSEGNRAGSNPLLVTARAVSAAGHEDLVVSNRTAERIRAENRRSRFLWQWRVCILTDPR